MLRITQQDNSKTAKQYYSSADYLSEGQEIVGSWGGEGARRLGLDGVVDRHSFDRLCDNRDPRTGRPLTARTRSDRTVGYDFTFSVPKSVSLLWAMSGDEQLLDAFRDAVDETMRDIEAEMKARVRKAGKDAERDTGNMAWAEFIHTTSRPVDGVPDPQLHAHCFVFNATWDDHERQWKAGQFRDLKRDAPYFQAAFRVRLAGKLQDLGFAVERKRDDFELAGVPASAIRRFSRRTAEIEKVAAERGITDPDRKAELGAETREKKDHELSWTELRREWDRRLCDIARGVDARVVLVGDRRQHRSVAAGEPLRLLEERAGLPVAEVTEILRQSGDYKTAARHLSDGSTAAGFAELDRLGWIREVPDADRYQALASAYLSATAERKRGGEQKSALVVSPTHAEAGRITHTIRAALKEQGKLGDERTVQAWVPAHLTDAEKGDAVNYEPGDLLQFHQNAPGHQNGSRLVVAGRENLPLKHAARFEVYRPVRLSLAVGDRVRVTANGKTKDGKHALRNGALYTVSGFTPRGDLVVDHGWVIGRDFGHLAHGYVVTSHASQGRTVDKVFVGLSAESFPATNRRTAYVAVTRGKEQAVIFTDSKAELLRAAQRPDEPLLATELAGHRPLPPRTRLQKHLAFIRRRATLAQSHESHRPDVHRARTSDREVEHAH